jgi:hypothetical protein
MLGIRSRSCLPRTARMGASIKIRWRT